MCKMNRRKFVKLLSAGTCGSIIHQTLFPGRSLMAYAAPPVMGALGANPILVVVNFAGGISHNWSPVYDSWYMDANPTVAYTPATSIPITASQGLHPSLPYLKTLWDEGTCAVVNMVGMGSNGVPNITRAHDLDTARKLTGILSDSSAYGGWPPRLTAQMSASLGGVSLTGESLVVQGDNNPPRAVGDLQNFGESNLFWGDSNSWFRTARDNLLLDGSSSASNPKFKGVRDSMVNVASMAQTLAQQTNITLPITFPNSGLGNNFRDVARIVNANLGTQFFFAEIGGNDTHSQERNSMPNTLREFNDAVSALVRCAKAQGWYSRLVILTLSEFGRTMENGNAGNDHGHANAMFAIGGGISGGRFIGPTPTQADLAGRSYLYNYWIDFRSVFYEAVQSMGFNADLVFPERISFSPTGLFG